MLTLRIAHCPRCHSTVAVQPPADVGACPYCLRVAPPTVTKSEIKDSRRRFFWLGALLGALVGWGR